MLPDNWFVVQLFLDMQTQWRVGFGGRTGLDYSVLPILPRWQQTPKPKRQALLDDLRVMEVAVLNQDALNAQTKA